MRLVRFESGGDVRTGAVRGGEIAAFAPGVELDALIRGEAEAVATAERFALDAVELLAPYVPRAVFGVGLNYAEHANEGGSAVPDEPQLFLKGPASVTGPGGPVVRPPGVEQLDYEGELAIVVGPGGSVFGYAVANDVSARDFLSDSQLTRHKAGDTFCPWGPWVTTADEVPDPYALRLRTWVDGELRQDATTGDMIFRAEAILAAIARTIAPAPGDLVLTGTPEGVGLLFDTPRLLTPGQRVRVEIDGLGAIEHEVVQGTAAS